MKSQAFDFIPARSPSRRRRLGLLGDRDSKELPEGHCLLASLVAIQGVGSRHTPQRQKQNPIKGLFLLRARDGFRTLRWENYEEKWLNDVRTCFNRQAVQAYLFQLEV